MFLMFIYVFIYCDVDTISVHCIDITMIFWHREWPKWVDAVLNERTTSKFYAQPVLLNASSYITNAENCVGKKYMRGSRKFWQRGSKHWKRFFKLMRGKKDHHRPANETPLNGVSLACRWWPIIECWLGSFVFFQGIRTSIAKKHYIFYDFSGGGGAGPPAPPLDPRMKYYLF